MNVSTYSSDEITHAVDVVSAVVEQSINAAPTLSVDEHLAKTHVLLQSFRAVVEQPLPTIQLDE